MSNSIVIKEPKRAVDKPKSSQTSGLSSIEKTLYDNNQLMKKNVDAMQKMANSMVESQKTTKSIDKELSNLKEKISELRKQKAQKATTPEKPSSSSSSTTTHRISYSSGISNAGNSIINKATTPGAAMSTAASVALAVGTGGILNPVVIKALGLDALASSILRGGYNVLKKTPSAIGNLLGLGSNSQTKTSGTTSSNSKATKDAKLHKKLDTIIHILEKTKNTTTDKKNKEKKPGLLSKLFGLLTSSGFLKAALAIGAGIAAWNLLSDKINDIIDKIKNIFGLNNFDPAKLPSMPAPILPTKPKSKPAETPKDTTNTEKSKAKELERKLRKTLDNDIKKIAEDYKTKIDSLKKEYDSKIKELTKEVDTLKKNLNDKTKSFNDQVEKQKEITEKEKTELKKQIEEQNKLIKNKEKDIENTKKEYEKKLQEQKKTHEREIKEIENKLKSEKESINNKIKENKATENAKVNAKAVDKAKISPTVSTKGTVGLNLGKTTAGKWMARGANAYMIGEGIGHAGLTMQIVKNEGLDKATDYALNNLAFGNKALDEVIEDNKKKLNNIEIFKWKLADEITKKGIANLSAVATIVGVKPVTSEAEKAVSETSIIGTLGDAALAFAGGIKQFWNNAKTVTAVLSDPKKLLNELQKVQVDNDDFDYAQKQALKDMLEMVKTTNDNLFYSNNPEEKEAVTKIIEILTELLNESKLKNKNNSKENSEWGQSKIPVIINNVSQTTPTPFSTSDSVNAYY